MAVASVAVPFWTAETGSRFCVLCIAKEETHGRSRSKPPVSASSMESGVTVHREMSLKQRYASLGMD